MERRAHESSPARVHGQLTKDLLFDWFPNLFTFPGDRPCDFKLSHLDGYDDATSRHYQLTLQVGAVCVGRWLALGGWHVDGKLCPVLVAGATRDYLNPADSNTARTTVKHLTELARPR